MCDCREGKIEDENGAIVGTGLLKAHDCEYIRWRNSFIPAAEKYANAQVAASDHGGAAWTRVFTRKIEELMGKCLRSEVNGRN